MTLISRNLTFDNRLNKWTLDVEIDGENETLVFDSKMQAYNEHDNLLNDGAKYFSLQFDGSL